MLLVKHSISYVSTSTLVITRSFSNSLRNFAPNIKSKKDIEAKKATDKKIERRISKKKLEAKKPASNSPLFMPINQALRYLRASEIGRPITEASISIQTNVLSDRGVAPLQGSVRLPKPLKETRILCLSNDEIKRNDALKNGATAVGDSKTVDLIKSGEFELDFDKIIATPDIEPILKSIAKILGPKGLMPNAKRGTVTENINELIQSTLGTQPFREKNSFVALTVARCDFSDEEVLKNILATSKAVSDSISKTKSKKPILLGKTVLSSTHGPGIIINF